MKSPVSITDVLSAKGNRKLAMLTAYDYPTARYADRAGMDMLLVGDSLAMVVLGHEDTLSVGMEEMLHHTRAVARAAEHSLVIGDMPFLSYQTGTEQAVLNAGRFLKEARADAVKLEGGSNVLPQVRAIARAGIPVQGHLGLTPQSAAQLGGFKVQAKSAEAGKKLVEEAHALCDAGCFSIVLEAVPAEIGAMVAEAVPVPIVGIGAGPDCDGQVLVMHDVVGLFDRFVPKFVKQYAQLGPQLQQAVEQYRNDVQSGSFPAREHSFSLSREELARLKETDT